MGFKRGFQSSVFSLQLLLIIFLFSCNKKSDCSETNCTAPCYQNYTPVCGCNGKTYSNDCYAECNGITEYTQGECN